MLIGVQITKSTLFRGVQQEFHNVYYYTLPSAVTAPSQTIVDELVATEKSLHANQVNFLRAAVWTAGGTKQENHMIHRVSTGGIGNQLNQNSMDKERAVLVMWKAGFSSTGKQVYLRKWYHSCGDCAGVSLGGAAILQNTDKILPASKTAIANKVEETRIVGAIETWELCAKSGRMPTHTAQTHDYLEHHQLGNAWRV